MKMTLLFFVLLGVAGNASAVTIQETDIENNLIALGLERGDYVYMGDRYILRQESGRQCTFTVTVIRPDVVMAKIDKCADKEDILIGSRLRKSALSASSHRTVLVNQASAEDQEDGEPAPVLRKKISPTTSALKGQGRFSLFALFSTASKMSFDGSLSIDNDPVAAKGDSKAESVPGIGLMYQQGGVSRLGYNLGLSHEFRRDIKSSAATIDGESFIETFSEPELNFSITTTFLNLMVAASDSAYLFAGLNFPFFKFNGNDPEFEISGKPGFQLGVGFDLAERVQFEILYKVLKFKETGLTVINFDNFNALTLSSNLNAQFSGLLATLKFVF